MGYALITLITIISGAMLSSRLLIDPQVAIPSMADSTKVYRVAKLSGADFDYNNTREGSRWNEAEVTTDFTYPWQDETPPLTTFRSLYDDEYFYFLYEVVDTSDYVFTETGQEIDVMNSDRVELFFLSKGTMNPYYCLEIDPQGQLFDYESRFYRHSNEAWAWPADHIEIQALPYEGGYAIAGRISLTSLREIGAIQDSTMTVGLFRANVVGVSQKEPVFKWISWITPDVAAPDFHIPSAFGTFVLQ